jgi:hypothetical protein
VLWEDSFQTRGRAPPNGQIPDFVTTALDRIRAHLPEESAGG